MATLQKIKENSSSTPSKWNELAGWIIKNSNWLKYAQKIATAVLCAIEKNPDINQRVLAEKLNVSPQYVSKMLKGQENMTLKTIAGLEDVLGIKIISISNFSMESTTATTKIFNFTPLYQSEKRTSEFSENNSFINYNMKYVA